MPTTSQSTRKAMPVDSHERQSLLMLGEISGQLKGLREMMEREAVAQNRRIDDLVASYKSARDLTEARLSRLETNERQMLMRNTGYGAAAGAVMAAVVELIRALKGG